MKRKHLESALSSIQNEFSSPKVELEQYATSVSLAASVVLMALDNDDIGEGKTALDLGCGTGMLAIGCALLGCDFVLAVDCDQEAIEIARRNVNDLELDATIHIISAKVEHKHGQDIVSAGAPSTFSPSHNVPLSGKGRSGRGRGCKQHQRQKNRPGSTKTITNVSLDVPPPQIFTCAKADDNIPLKANCVDTVVTNPPFGTKNNIGIDVQFLRTAIRLSRRAVYSFHKTSTRDYLLKKLNEWGLEAKVVAQMSFDIPNTYKFHKKKNVDVEVDLIHIIIPETAAQVENDDINLTNETAEALRIEEQADPQRRN